MKWMQSRNSGVSDVAMSGGRNSSKRHDTAQSAILHSGIEQLQ
jgi:hypothetical protein